MYQQKKFKSSAATEQNFTRVISQLHISMATLELQADITNYHKELNYNEK
jgi:hypothetical protein